MSDTCDDAIDLIEDSQPLEDPSMDEEFYAGHKAFIHDLDTTDLMEILLTIEPSVCARHNLFPKSDTILRAGVFLACGWQGLAPIP